MRRLLVGVVLVMAVLMGCEAPAGEDGTAARTAGVGPEARVGPWPVVVAPEATANPVPLASRPVVTRGEGGPVATPATRPTTGIPVGTRQAPTPTRSSTALPEGATRDVTGRVATPRVPRADDAGRLADRAACRAGTLVPEPGSNPVLVEDCAVLLAVWADSMQDWRLNWSVERPISEWDGVKLGGRPPRVHEIDLAGHDLGGEIPPALGRLTALEVLDLSHNQLVGGIPVELGGLAHLKELRLGHNALRGTIPSTLGRHSDLRHLSLFNNELSGPVPAELGDLQTLFHLNLAVNRLSGPIPPKLGGMPHLTTLALGTNRLSGSIPPELGQLSNLTFLDLTDNRLTGQIPVDFGRLDRLRGLFLSNNQLTGRIPPELGQLLDLTYLELDGNNLTGESPRLIEGIVIHPYHPERPCNPFRLVGVEYWFWENQVRWHPDGSTVIFSQGPLVYAASVDGSRVLMVADGLAPPNASWFPKATPMTSFDLSPKGDHLVYATCAYRSDPPDIIHGDVHTYDIAVVDLERVRAERLTDQTTFENYPSWSPDGTRISFLASRGSGLDQVRNTRLAVMAADGSSREQIATEFPIVMYPPKWSPDGERLAVVGGGPDADIFVTRLFLYTLRPDGKVWQRLGRTASGPSWSPDGSRLAFVATDDDSGDDRILVTMAADGSQAREVPVADEWKPGYAGGHSILDLANWIPTLAWSPTGEQLLYTCGLRVCVVSLDGTPVGQSPSEWWSGSTAAWSPDGTRIAVAPGAIEESGRAVRSGPLLYTMAPDGSDVQALAEAGIHAVAARAWRLSVAESRAACSDGYVVSEPEANPGLVRDCEVLLGLRDALFGEVVSNWHPGTPIGQWVGATVERSPPRVTALEMPQVRLASLPERSIPEDLSALTQLQTLDLSNSRLAGTIPPELVRLESLAHLALSGNDLTGFAPPELRGLSNLITLDLSRNALTGPIPNEVIQLVNLQRLDLSGNGFAGRVPAEMEHLTKLEELNLSNNRLTGSIPPELGRLSHLRSLSLSGNELTGSIPPELGRLTALRRLNLHMNQLTGPIPPELDGLASLEWIRLTDNDLTGCISPRLKFRLEQAECQQAGV